MLEMIVIPVCIVCVYSHFSFQYRDFQLVFLNFENHFALLRGTFIEFIAKTI
jgi:hypothetical protein